MLLEPGADTPSDITVDLSATMTYSYGRSRRPGIRSETTFDAIINGERTTTTRFATKPGWQMWSRATKGQIVRFFEDSDMQGRSVLVRITDIRPIDLENCSMSMLNSWSLGEGWTMERGRSAGRENGPGLWIRYELLQYPKT